MATNHKASLQVLLALAARLQLGRRTKFLALALFTDRSVYRRLATTCERCCLFEVHDHKIMKVHANTTLLHPSCFETSLCTFRCIPLLVKERPIALPPHGESLYTLVCLSRAAQCQSKDTCISMADIQAAAAEVP